MIINGVDTEADDELLSDSLDMPETVPGRVAHIDADFLAYQVSSIEGVTFEEMQHNVKVKAETLRLMAGAESAVLHLTAAGSNKGHRPEQALLLDYQANRDGKEKPPYLQMIKTYMADNVGGRLWDKEEADDGMAIMQHKALAKGEGNLSVIISMDKDLRMVKGLHMEWDTGEFFGSIDSPFGAIYICTKTSTKKCMGWGTKFFWAQMLMGDTADNIKGLPFATGGVLNKFKPTKKITEAKAVILSGIQGSKRDKALKVLADRKGGNVGPMLALTMLEDCNTDKECFVLIRKVYELCLQHHPQSMVNWRDDMPITSMAALVSNAKLLWMRRYEDTPNDVIDWIKETCK